MQPQLALAPIMDHLFLKENGVKKFFQLSLDIKSQISTVEKKLFSLQVISGAVDQNHVGSWNIFKPSSVKCIFTEV